MSKKIKMIKFYQGVVMGDNTGTLSSFTPDEGLSDAKLQKGLQAEVQDKGVLLTSKGGSALVPWNNVAYIQFMPEEVKPVESKKAK
ncbi:MAG: hypothetical protein ACAH17_00150 [Candidatus Paceibacterota bacterium]